MICLRRAATLLACAFLGAILVAAPPLQAKPRPAPKPSAVPPLPTEGRFVYLETNDWDGVLGQTYVLLPPAVGEDGHARVWFIRFHVSYPGGPKMDRRLDGLAMYYDVDCATRKIPSVPGAFKFGPNGERGLVIEPWGEPKEVAPETPIGRSMAMACDPDKAADGALPSFDAAWDDALKRPTPRP